ncbi:MAG: hypothetical protein R3A79_02840 [Nannocystaceae bacterium]
MLALTGCAGDDGETGATGETGETGETGGDANSITEDTVWSEDQVLEGIVTVKDGAVLTVMPGVTVRGTNGSALVIAQGSRLEAAGTADMPIVFTSSQSEGSRARGDWGGIVFLGEAESNVMGGVGVAEGLEDQPNYGGGDSPKADYNCGTLQYVRVEYAGYELTTDNELNGVTFYACGTGTTVDHLQVHMGEDDGIEMFGGQWSGAHIVITGAGDDSVDIDQGWTGALQYVVIQQDSGTGNFAFEISNQEANRDAEPRTKPMISNVTAIGGAGSKSAGIKLKEGAAGEFYNTIIMGFNNAQVELTEEQTEAQADAGMIKIMNSLFYNNGAAGEAYVVSEGSVWDLLSFIEDPVNSNLFGVDPMLANTGWGTLDVAPDAASPVHNDVSPPAPFDGAGSYIGAVKSSADDWTKGWTTYVTN